MPQKISRRQFASIGGLIAGTALTGGRALAIEPIKRPGQARLRLSLAAYSFRDYFRDSDHGRSKQANIEKQIDMLEFVDYCADHELDGAEVTSYYFPPNATNEFFLKLKHHAFMRGIALSGTAVGNTFTFPAGEKRDKQIAHVKQWIDRSALMGIPHIRIFAGSLEGQSVETAKRNCIEALNEVCPYAAEKGVFLGIENHGGIVAEPEPLLEIVRAVQSPWLGINLDTGNFQTADPYKDLERCAPYAVNVQIKTEVQPKGQQKQSADLKRAVEILRKANYQGYVALEYEAAEDAHIAVPRALEELKRLL